MAFDSSHEKFNILQKIIFENLVKANDLSKTKNEPFPSSFINQSTIFLKEKNNLDENQLNKLNSIISNVPIELIKQSYEKHRQENERDIFNFKKRSFKLGLHNIKSNSSLTQFKSNSQLRRKQIENGSFGKPPAPPSSTQQPKNDKEEKLSSSKNSLSVNKGSKPQTSSTSSLANASTNHHNHQSINTTNQIVIHVCDEAKRLKQDFMCPRELLVKEMKYFSYNLNINVTNTSQNTSGAHAHASSISALSKKSLDEIDISVHCDINIFDWLMRYVKRNHPNLIEKNIATPENYASDSVNNIISHNKDGEIISIEPKLDLNNCVSILLSSDFLLMGNLVDKCILFIADNLDSVLNIPCVMSGINDSLLNKIASCVYVTKLEEVYDKKDKLKTKLFQRKIEFLFDVNKLKQPFQNSSILNDWKNNKYTSTIIKRKASIRKSIQENDSTLLLSSSSGIVPKSAAGGISYENSADFSNNYQNYLYECENDASTLFKCKLCSRLMTKNQATKLKCQLGILNERGEYVYLHVPDEKFDLTNFLQMLKEKLKTWQLVYWCIWALIKSFKCKKCGIWFRLVDFNKCRLNDYTFCAVHDTKKPSSNSINTNTPNSGCYCIHCDHVVDDASVAQLYEKSPILRKPNNSKDGNYETPDMRLAKFTEYVLINFDKHKNEILNGYQQNEVNSENLAGTSGPTKSFCDQIESILHLEHQSKNQNFILFNNKNSKLVSQTVTEFESNFVDSINAKHITLMSKSMLSLLKFTQIALVNQHNTNQEVVNNNAVNTANNNSSSSTNANISNMPIGATNSSSGINSGATSSIGQISNVNIVNLLNSSLDLRSCLNLISKMDPLNIFNCMDVLYFLRVDNKMKWDSSKAVRLNQDNQREDDLKRLREISSCLIKAKLLEENHKTNNSQKSALVNALTASYSSNLSTRTNYPGGIYCRVEFDWKLRQGN